VQISAAGVDLWAVCGRGSKKAAWSKNLQLILVGCEGCDAGESRAVGTSASTHVVVEASTVV
jgi:hypothetical protein